MNYRLLLSSEAEKDLDEIIEYYESVRQGLGAEFYLSYKDAERLILENPKLFAFIESEIRRVLLNKFKYAVYYHIIEDKTEIEILAVVHTSRDPDYWRKRVKLQ
jgi:toxin ParE1/3/4